MNSVHPVIKTFLLSAVLIMFIPDRLLAQSLIGLWRTDIVQLNDPLGQTNKAYDTVEFLEDGSFIMKSLMLKPAVNGGDEGGDPISVAAYGNFKIVDDNHITLQVTKMKFGKGQLTPIVGVLTTNSYSFSGDKFELHTKIDNTTSIFHRVKKEH
jgi:hypothetical protein